MLAMSVCVKLHQHLHDSLVGILELLSLESMRTYKFLYPELVGRGMRPRDVSGAIERERGPRRARVMRGHPVKGVSQLPDLYHDHHDELSPLTAFPPS